MRSLTWDEVWARRLSEHRLHTPAEQDKLVDTVRAVCGIHAQMMPAAEVAIGIRVAGITRQNVRDALWKDRSLVKCFGIRGTVHLFPADELPVWIAALRENKTYSVREEQRLAQMGLTRDQTHSIVGAIGEALEGQCLTYDELGDEVARLTGSWVLDAVSPAFGGNWPRWRMALGAATNAGLLCFGPNRGAKTTFVRPDQWLGGWKERDGPTALREVFLRYLTAYGPATPRDFAQWFTTPLPAAQKLMRDVHDELEEVDTEGHRAWLPARDAADHFPLPDNVVRLLSHFDSYVVGCHPRDQLVRGSWAEWSRAYGGAGNHPVVMIDGVLRGIWLHRRKGKRVEIQISTFDPLYAEHQDRLHAAIARIGEILEATPDVTLGPLQPRPHL